jgi:hypothetical protein
MVGLPGCPWTSSGDPSALRCLFEWNCMACMSISLSRWCSSGFYMRWGLADFNLLPLAGNRQGYGECAASTLFAVHCNLAVVCLDYLLDQSQS